MSATLRIETLGRCVAVAGERRIEPNAEMVFAMLLLLGLERGRPWPRTELAEILWPDASYSIRASRLRWLLAKLRGLGLRIESRSTDVMLASNDVVLDIDVVDQLAPSALGELLPGYAPEISSRFTQWLDGQRDELGAVVLGLLAPRLRDSRRLKDWANIAPTAAAILRVDSLNEEANLALAESHYRLGSPTQALACLDRYLAALGEDLPDTQLRARLLLRRIRSADELTAHSTEPRFVGRSEQLARIEGALIAARQGRGSALTLLGPAGIGKTRLLDEASIRARIARMQVVRVRCQRGDSSRPLSGIVDLVTHLMGTRGAAGCQPTNLERLRQLTDPSSGSLNTDDNQNPPSPEVLRAQLASALIDLLDAVSAEAPIVIQIDDAQWLDRSLNWLWDVLLSWGAARSVAWLFAFRTSRRNTPSLDLPVIPVGALDADAASELLDELLQEVDGVVGQPTREALLARGAGSPLFLRELIRQWRVTGRMDSLPGSLLALFESGLASLSRYALRTLQVAAILGTRATVERIEFVVELTRSEFVDALTELESAGILTTDSTGATYGHVLWAEAAIATLSSNISRLLHRHAAERFDEELIHAPSATLLWEGARHWELAGYVDRARSATVRGAEHLARNGFPSDAANAYGRVVQGTPDPVEKLPLLRRRMDLLVNAGLWNEVIADAEAHERLSDEIDPHHDPHSAVELIRLGAMHWYSLSPSALVMARTLACGRDLNATASHRLGALKIYTRAAHGAPPKHLVEVHQLACSIRPETFEDSWNRWRVEWEYELHCGDIGKAVIIADRQMEATAGSPTSTYRAYSLAQAAAIYTVAGRIVEGRQLFDAAIQLHIALGMLGSLAIVYDDLLGVSLDIDSLGTIQNTLDAARKSLLTYSFPGEKRAQEVLLRGHEAQFELLAGRPEAARSYAFSLEESRAVSGPTNRARLLAVQLELHGQPAETAEIDQIATEVRACFTEPDVWLDWPASVYARYLERAGRLSEAATFSHWFISEIRRERYPVPERCGALTRLAALRTTHQVAV